MANPDPGGSSSDLVNLQENLHQQQEKISALKELVRQSEASQGRNNANAKEKVRNIANRLAHMKNKASKSRQRQSFSDLESDSILEESQESESSHLDSSNVGLYSSTPNVSRARSETPGSEKIQLLKEQMEKNRRKMAEREQNKKGIEQLVTQLKAKFDTTQQSLEKSSELGRSMTDLSYRSSMPSLSTEKFRSACDLTTIAPNVDKKKMQFLENRVNELEIQLKMRAISPVDQPSDKDEAIRLLEARILDLEENLKEKESIIEARTKAVSLMSENLSLKGKETVDQLEDTKSEMYQMQQKFIEIEEHLKHEIAELKAEIHDKNDKIKCMEDEINNKEVEVISREANAGVAVNTLNETVEILKKRIQELEDKDMSESIEKIDKSELENAELQTKITDLEESVDNYKKEIEELSKQLEDEKEKLMEKTTEYNVLNANFSVLQEKLKQSAPKSLFSRTADEEVSEEVGKLKSQLDAANKSMIKTKLQTKQLQKQLNAFKKMSDVNKEVVRLTDEVQHLNQRIVELEDEKGNLQLKLLKTGEDNIELATADPDKKFEILESTCQNQTSAIQLLEEEKLSMSEELTKAKQQVEVLEVKLQDRDNQPKNVVPSDIDYIELEEVVETHKREIESLKLEIEQLVKDKDDLSTKLDRYVSENMELLEKIEKLSKGSSAESIEIVENLTPQEKLEMEEFVRSTENRKQKDEADGSTSGADKNSEATTKLQDENTELKEKIKMFTVERKEVLEKLETLKVENSMLNSRLEEVLEKKTELESEYALLNEDKQKTYVRLDITLKEKDNLVAKIRELEENRLKIQDEIELLRKSTTSSTSARDESPESTDNSLSDDPPSDTANKELTDKLKSLESELDNYRKAKDKNAKFNCSKRLAKEAKAVHDAMHNLIEENTAVQKELQSLKIELDHLRTVANSRGDSELQQEIDKLKTEVIDMKASQANYDNLIEDLKVCKIELMSYRNLEKELKNTINELDASLNEAVNQKKTIETKTTAMQHEYEEQIYSLKNYCREMEDEHSRKYSDLEVKCNNYEAAVSKLSGVIENHELEHKQLVTQHQAELKDLKNRINEAKSTDSELSQIKEELSNKQETIDTLNAQIIDLYKQIEQVNTNLEDKEEEILRLQDTIDDITSEKSSLEMISNDYKQKIGILENKLETVTGQLNQVKSTEDLERRSFSEKVEQLEKQNHELSEKNREHVDKLKKFAANIKKKVAQCQELETKLAELEKTESNNDVTEKQLKALQNQIHQFEQERDQLLIKLEESMQKVQRYSDENMRLSNILEKEERTVAELTNEISLLRSECSKVSVTLQQSENNSNKVQSLQAENEELEKELYDKMEQLRNYEKDLTAKGNQITKLQEEVERVKENYKTCEASLQAANMELLNNTTTMDSQNIKIEKCKTMIKERNREIKHLREQVAALKSSESKPDDTEKLQKEQEEMKNRYEGQLEQLRDQLGELQITYQSELNRLHAKSDENHVVTETLENENHRLKDRIMRLEECIAMIEERRSSLERQKNLLGQELQDRATVYEQNEDELIRRLNAISKNDELIDRKLQETENERIELLDRVNILIMEKDTLSKKIYEFEHQVQPASLSKLDELEKHNSELLNELACLQAESKKQTAHYEKKLNEKANEVDELEAELSSQLNDLDDQRKALLEKLERSKDETSELKDEVVRLKESLNTMEQVKQDLERENTWIRMQNENMSQDQIEIQELRMQVVQDQTEIENLKQQNQQLISNHEHEVENLQQQITTLDSLRMQVGQNQTDDQVFIQNENERLQSLLAEKVAEIEHYQRQNLQLQMSGQSQQVDIFGSTENQENDSEQVRELQRRIDGINGELNHSSQRQRELETENASLRQQITEYVSQHEDASKHIQSLLAANEQLKQRLQTLESGFSMSDHFVQMQNISQLGANAMSSHSSPPPVPSIPVLQTNLELGTEPDDNDQQKIEDLVRNVSDLEKYVAELERKVQHSNALVEEHQKVMDAKNLTIAQLTEENEQCNERILKLTEEQIQQQIIVPTILPPVSQSTTVEDSVQAVIPTNEGIPAFNSSMFFDPNEVTAFDQAIVVPPTSGSDDNQPEYENRQPVVEEIIVPKKAYVCQPGDEDQIKPSDIIVADDEWGWNPNEAALEAQFQQSVAASQQATVVKADQDERIHTLELERDRLREEMIALQVKSGKMIKKLKEYKVKIESLEASQKRSSSSFDELSLAIQEEMKSQIDTLEDKLKKMKEDQDKVDTEKQNLLKRVDVLTNANDRMTEMKEKQDNEIEFCRMKIKQLTQEMQQMGDWNNENYGNSPAKSANDANNSSDELNKKINELNAQVNDLSVDNEELQALLEEEKNNRQSLEGKLDKLQNETRNVNTLNESIDSLNAKYTDELQTKQNKINHLEGQISELMETIDSLSKDSNSIKSHLDQLKVEHERKINENESLVNEMKMLAIKNSEMSSDIQRMQSENLFINDGKISELSSTIEQLTAQLQYKESESVHLNSKIAELEADSNQSSQYEAQLNDCHKRIDRLLAEKETLEMIVNALSLQQKNQDNSFTNEQLMDAKCKQLELQITSLQSEKEDMEKELSVLNEQVMNSLELEDRMKSIVLELDMKNIEITELKASLMNTSKTLNPESDTLRLQIDQYKLERDELQRLYSATIMELEQLKQQQQQQQQQSQLYQQETIPSASIPQSIEHSVPTVADQLNVNVEAEQDLMVKMQAALENQELEIVTLKEQLAIRSAEYARLASQTDPFGQRSTSISAINLDGKQKLASASVPQSELDLALYMLHQRDMRCEELTMELTSLLEERDTLQLKLSNSIRQLEATRHKTDSGETSSTDTTPEKIPHEDMATIRPNELPASGTEQEANINLSTKLNELRSVGHSRDKTLHEDRVKRQRQMELVQKDLANLPKDAVQELVGPDYTANQSDSPSNTLLNWLWGKNNRGQQ